MGLHPKWQSHLRDIQVAWRDQWVAFVLERFVLVGMYATGPQTSRASIWKSLMEFSDPLIVNGDLKEYRQNRGVHMEELQ